MKCKVHPYEEVVGVCPSCLRERLLALIAAQNELPATHHHRRQGSDPPAPPLTLPFPRSVSPYVSCRRSVDFDASPGHPCRLQRFFSTPQVGPALDAASGHGGFGEIDNHRRRRFSLSRILFGRRRREEADPGLGASKASATGSWFASLIRGRARKNKELQLSSAAEEQSSRGAVERVISPAMNEDDDQHTDPRSEISREQWRPLTPSPMWGFLGIKRQPRSSSPSSGFSVCLSPVVRFSPNARRRKGADSGAAGDIRSSASSVHHRNQAVGGAPPLGRNRSRKLGNFK